ncbi:MAG: peptidoglycan-binding protein [Christensenellales bacterium]|jgi:peptidoglycan hydrolase-like protein with peptidoglycan-binding domain
MARATIRIGSRGQDVTVVQLLLGSNADGIFGSRTRASVIGFQKASALFQDGVVGPRTWAALSAASPLLRQGSRNDAVKALQILIAVGVDGIFGPKTRHAVVEFQKEQGLSRDGIVGPRTWAALLGGAGKQTVLPSDGKPVYYRQNDPRWGALAYTSTGNARQTYANSGCVPAVVAMIVATLKDGRVTPPDMGKLAVANGYRTVNSGTMRSFVTYAAGLYGLKSTAVTMGQAKDALRQGKLVSAFMGPGYWTNGGHNILLWKYNAAQDVMYALDPASPVKTQQPAQTMAKEANQFFVVEKI